MFNRTVISYAAEMESRVGLTFTDDKFPNTGIADTQKNESIKKNLTTKNISSKFPVTGEEIVLFLPYLGLLLLLIWLIVIGKKYKGEKRK